MLRPLPLVLLATMLALPPSTAHAVGTLGDTSASPARPGTFAPVHFVERDMSGPRVGFTVAPFADGGYRALRDHGMGPVVSQFGWHFEHQVAPGGGGPQFVTQFVPLFGGVEYGKLIPSFTAALGVRLPSGTEFGVGPSFTLVNSEGRAASAIMLAAGRTLDYGGVNVPVNVAVSLNQDGTRVTALVGYAIRRAAR